MRATLFIADLHLSEHTPDLNNLFFRFLEDWRDKAESLYILGDFFDAWIGDDDVMPIAQQVAVALRQWRDNGVKVYFIAGNRDFLLGKNYALEAGMTLLPENTLITLYGKHYLLTHGDEMCTDDKFYQIYRRIMRAWGMQNLLQALPLNWRKYIAQVLRKNSKNKKNKKNNYLISDVTNKGVRMIMERNRGLDAIIHGHTHRPNIHYCNFTNKNILRYVLPDWHDGKGGFLLINKHGAVMHQLES